MRQKRHTWRSKGFSLIEAMLVTFILAVLIAVFLPQLVHPRRASRISCVNNLKQIGLSFRLWAGDNGDKFPMEVSVTNGGTKELVGSGIVYVHFLVLSNELSTPKVLFCPNETNAKRKPAIRFDTTTPLPAGQIPLTNDLSVSYFIGVDANQTNSAMILSGDDNFTAAGKLPKPGLLQLWTNTPVAWTSKRHDKHGNVALVDGSVVTPNSQRLRQILCNTGLATNRLAMP